MGINFISEYNDSCDMMGFESSRWKRLEGAFFESSRISWHFRNFTKKNGVELKVFSRLDFRPPIWSERDYPGSEFYEEFESGNPMRLRSSNSTPIRSNTDLSHRCVRSVAFPKPEWDGLQKGFAFETTSVADAKSFSVWTIFWFGNPLKSRHDWG